MSEEQVGAATADVPAGTESSLFEAARLCLLAQDPSDKAKLTVAAAEAWRSGRLDHSSGPGPEPIGEPGRPARPLLVPPRELPRRGVHSPNGRGALIHALAHIEFNAINLAWDAVYRFRGLPRPYYDDWVRVALEEAHHFRLLVTHLRSLGFRYGDFPAHNGLWEMAQATADDALARMALVPRVLEARGLDVTQGLADRLAAAGDSEAVAILGVILSDEIGHVAVGNRWYHYLCDQRGVDPLVTFKALIGRHLQGQIKQPMSRVNRLRAGFTEAELQLLMELSAANPATPGD